MSHHDNESCHSSSLCFLSFLTGALIGAGLGILLAPQSGKETRGKIKELSSEMKGKTTEAAEDVLEKLQKTLEEGKVLLKEKKNIIASAIEAGKEAYEKEKEKHVSK